jgi:target of rapamycin complex 2 subunit MAPKAP1
LHHSGDISRTFLLQIQIVALQYFSRTTLLARAILWWKRKRAAHHVGHPSGRVRLSKWDLPVSANSSVKSLVSYQLRTNYLNAIKDGVGERLITINDGFLNTPGFKAAGWRPNVTHIKRTHSPPIPTAIASEYFQAPRSAGLPPVTLDDEVEEGGMVTGGGAGDTVGPGMAIKRRRRREQMEEEDSSDLSDESDEDGDQRAAQQIRFAKMPVRMRSGSSPIRNSTSRDISFMASPARPLGHSRRGSQSAVEAVKERARRDTVTSSEMSSENEFDTIAFKRQHVASRGAAKTTRVLPKQSSDTNVTVKRQGSDLLEEEMEDYSDGSDMSSAFAESVDSVSILDSVDGPLSTPINPSPTHVVGAIPRQLTKSSPKKPKPVPATLQALPPPRPISAVQPKSMLSAMIKAKRTKAAMPFEGFAPLSGQGDPNPLVLRIWVPFAKSPQKSYEVLIRRTVQGGEARDYPITVADLIGLSLWRYSEEKMEPALTAEKLNVNRWTLRLIEDEEVDYDFPALDRTKPVVAFTTVNNRAVRSRTGSKPYDEFALVEATEEQFQENLIATPQFKQESVASEGGDDDVAPKITPAPILAAPQPPRGNPLLTTMSALRSNSATLLDVPAAPGPQIALRHGVQKFLRVHIHSSDAAPGQMVTVDVTTDTYLAEVLDIVCKKRQLDKANHVLKLTGSGIVILLDRTVGSIGNRSDLDLFRRCFATDGPLTLTGSPVSTSPKSAIMADGPALRKTKKPLGNAHPLAQEAMKQDELGSANYRKYTVWRKQPMRFVGMNEKVIAIDGEYLHIMPAGTGKTMFEGQGKTTTVHFSNVIGCKGTRRHPTNFKVCFIHAVFVFNLRRSLLQCEIGWLR